MPALRVNALLVEGDVLIAKYRIVDETITQQGARELVFAVLLESFFLGAYRAQAKQVRYVDDETGLEITASYGPP